MSDPNTVAIVYRLFEAALGRIPDAWSLGYQVALLDAGLDTEGLAQVYAASPEFVQRYGALSNTAFVTQLYENVLHREPDVAGLAYHVGRLDAGVSRADVLLGFSESPENIAATAAVTDGIVYVPMVVGTNAADSFTVTPEHTDYEGGAGVDIASLPGPHDSYLISAGSTTTVRAPDGGVYLLHDVERLHFADATVAIDTGVEGHAGAAYRLYQAAFGRAPDQPGLEFQIHAMDEGASWVQVAANFLASPEFTAKYGNVASLDDMQFLTLLHHNMSANPDAFAIQVQLAQLQGGASRADILTEVTESYLVPFATDVALLHGIVIGS
ncbi:MAG TPA: DUF4214 domain-containing protein [Ramlibacter sp.]|nr:DUF4214 domain-containing protein [Ramlibacter sp.]